MSSFSKPPNGYEDMLRGGLGSSEQGPVQGNAQHSTRRNALPASPLDHQQMSDMLDAQFQLREVAQVGRAQAIRALVETAEALCPSQWDKVKRAGHNPEEWAPENMGKFIVRHTLSELQRVYVAQQPDLAAEYERTSSELISAREELGRLKLQLQQAQASARTTAEKLAQAASGRRGARAANLPSPDEQVEVAQAGSTDDDADDAHQLAAVPLDRIDAVIKLMATTGLSRDDKIREQLAEELGVDRGSGRVSLPARAIVHHGLVMPFPCVVEWPGEKARRFLVLTAAGRARAVELKAIPVPNEYEAGMKLHKTADHLYLVLTATDILRGAGYTEVSFLPECFQVAGGEYCPDIAAREEGRLVYVECERSRDKAREAKWSRAAQANDGIIRLITPNRKIMDAITSEIKATTGSAFKLWAFNISEYAAKKRGQDGSLWLHQR